MRFSTNSSYRSRHQLVSTINITPFVDVMLVLLVVFMLSSSEIISSLLINVPEVEKSNEMVKKNNSITVSISHAGNIYIDDKVVHHGKLLSELNKISHNDKNMNIFINGDEKVNYGLIAKIIDKITTAGFKQIALVTKSS